MLKLLTCLISLNCFAAYLWLYHNHTVLQHTLPACKEFCPLHSVHPYPELQVSPHSQLLPLHLSAELFFSSSVFLSADFTICAILTCCSLTKFCSSSPVKILFQSQLQRLPPPLCSLRYAVFFFLRRSLLRRSSLAALRAS